MVERLKNYITTVTNTHFSPTEPCSDDINIEDIAHSLSYTCKSNGHLKHFYSIAQHSINCAIEAEARGYDKSMQLACLLNNASKAYIGDLVNPIKIHLSKYCGIDENLQSLIYKHFGVEDFDSDIINAIDKSINYYEHIYLTNEVLNEEKPDLYSKPNIEEEDFSKVKHEFLRLFKSLANTNIAVGTFVGIDISKGGWIAVIINDNGFKIKKYNAINEIIEEYNTANSIIIDLPIGLPENIDEAKYRPETEARKMLSGNRKSSVFPVPCRQTLSAADVETARSINKQNLKKSLAAQSFGLKKYIREIDDYLKLNPNYKNIIRESHPEVVFTILNNGKSLDESKLTEEGLKIRVDLLAHYYSDAGELKTMFSENKYPKSIRDDIVDAFSLALVGYLGQANGFKTLPKHPKKDSQGLLMQMVLPNIY